MVVCLLVGRRNEGQDCHGGSVSCVDGWNDHVHDTHVHNDLRVFDVIGCLGHDGVDGINGVGECIRGGSRGFVHIDDHPCTGARCAHPCTAATATTATTAIAATAATSVDP